MGLVAQNIAIIGCGPGGLASALFLAQQGHQVTLFERFSEPRPLGSGLLIQPSGQQVLDSLGLLDRIRQLASPVHQLHGISVHNGRRALDMKYQNARHAVSALGIHRASLFETLMQAVKEAGIPIETCKELVGVSENESAIEPVFADGISPAPFDLLVDASGARSPLATGRLKKLSYGAFWTTVDIPTNHEVMPNALDQRYWHASKMAGIMPVGINPATGNQGAAIFWSEKPENAAGVMDAGIEKFRKEYCKLWPKAEPFVAQIASMDELTMAVYGHRTGRSQTSNRLYHVGDSWHCTSPQLGQGANMALIDASALATAVENAVSIDGISKRYSRLRSFHIELYQFLSVMFTPLYQSNGRILPFVRDLAIHHFARWPVVRSFITHIVSGVLGLKHIRQKQG
ncbi:NAD(P)/FAD-dependent oxidoreductase [Sphingorhabdus sp. EL138]|uniref:FAD-dependent oxidoreductase n=1 Tax=Sphingorhabdus sp. EL138 TaxID=2073156 RepID=UPI0013A56253|nr:NAD(P)/FAD-dependent oxidoreductase [Sphingorhabdus sp. EL138]